MSTVKTISTYPQGGTGQDTLGTAGQVQKVNSGSTGMEWGSAGLLNGSDYFGTGADGSVTISSNTTLTSDMNYSSLTVDAGYTLNCDGYRVFCTGTVTVNGSITRNGNDDAVNGGSSGYSAGYYTGVGGDGATALTGSGPLGGGLGGVKGANGTTSYNNANAAAGATTASGYGYPGANGGESGRMSGGYSRGTGIGGPITKNWGVPFDLLTVQTMMMLDFGGQPGGGGGGGGYNTSVPGSAGGGGGCNGGVIYIAANAIVVGATGIIQANGSDGGNGGSQSSSGGTSGSGGGGGAGGNGGAIYLISSSYTNSGTVEANGGIGGTKGLGRSGGTLSPVLDGLPGTNGYDGLLIQMTV